MDSEQKATLTFIAVLGFLFIIIYFIFRGSRQTKGFTDFATGSLRHSPYFVGVSLAATMTSSATFLVNPGFVARYGVSAMLGFGLSVLLGIVAGLVFFSKRFRLYGEKEETITLAHWIGSRFNNKGLSMFFGFISLFLIAFMVLVCVALSRLLAEVLQTDATLVLVLLVIIVFGYMMFGGANGMIYSNSIQAFVMILVSLILIASGFEHFGQGIDHFLEKLKIIDPNLSSITNPGSSFFRDYFEIFIANFLIGLAAVCQPHIITRALFLRSSKEVNKYLSAAIITEILFFGVLVIGLYARLEFPDLMDGSISIETDDIVPKYINQITGVLGIIVVLGTLSAGLSTLEGLIHAIPSTFTFDFLQPLFRDRIGTGTIKEQRLVVINRYVIAAFGVLVILVAHRELNEPEFSVGVFAKHWVFAYMAAAFIPIVIGLFLKEIPSVVPFVGALTALIIHFIIFEARIGGYMKSEFRNPTIAAAFAILGSLIFTTFLLYFIRCDRFIRKEV